MSTLWQCDWCGAVWDTHGAVALLDIDFAGNTDRKLHACPDHLPDDWEADSGEIPDAVPLVSSGEWKELRDGE